MGKYTDLGGPITLILLMNKIFIYLDKCKQILERRLMYKASGPEHTLWTHTSKTDMDKRWRTDMKKIGEAMQLTSKSIKWHTLCYIVSIITIYIIFFQTTNVKNY